MHCFPILMVQLLEVLTSLATLFKHWVTSLLNPNPKPINVSQSSITTIDNVMYPLGCSFILGIIGIMYYTIYGVWNCITSFTNYSSSSITFSFSLYCITAWYNCLCRLWVTTWFMLITILPVFFVTYLNPYNKCMLKYNS